MPDDFPASRRELDALTSRIDSRIDQIDSEGTRGTLAAVSVVQAQIAELIRDMGKLEGRLDVHDQRHDREERARVTGRRFVISTMIAVVMMLLALLALVIPLAARPR